MLIELINKLGAGWIFKQNYPVSNLGGKSLMPIKTVQQLSLIVLRGVRHKHIVLATGWHVSIMGLRGYVSILLLLLYRVVLMWEHDLSWVLVEVLSVIKYEVVLIKVVYKWLLLLLCILLLLKGLFILYCFLKTLRL